MNAKARLLKKILKYWFVCCILTSIALMALLCPTRTIEARAAAYAKPVADSFKDPEMKALQEELAQQFFFDLPAKTEIIMETTVESGYEPTIGYLAFFVLMVSAIPATLLAFLVSRRERIIKNQDKKITI